MQAQKNKWASQWTENWFYLRLADEPDLCGALPKVEVVAAEASSTAECLAAVDAMRTLSRQQCGWDLVEEFLCVKMVPLMQDLEWFDVHVDAKYEPWGLKFLKLNLKTIWREVLAKGRTSVEGAGFVLEVVRKESEDLVGPLMSPELKAIKKSLDSRRRVNMCFDLLGVAYPDYPPIEASGGEGGSKRKRGMTGGHDGKGPNEDAGVEGAVLVWTGRLLRRCLRLRLLPRFRRLLRPRHLCWL